MAIHSINLQAPINKLGYGVAGTNIYLELAKLADINLYPIGGMDYDIKHQNSIAYGVNKGILTPNFTAPSVKIYHQFDLASRIGKGCHVGFPFFELDTFKDNERRHIDGCDKLFVSSEWAKRIVYENTHQDKRNVHVVPLGVDRTVFQPRPYNKNSNEFVFICVGKWEKRKCQDEVIIAFQRAFGNKLNVKLKLFCTNPFIKDDSYWRNVAGGRPNIKIMDRLATQEDLAEEMSKADCLVGPSLAEAWNLELLEAMSCGLQVITTNYSGHTEFCTTENAYLLNFTDFEVAHDGVFFKNEIGRWGKFDTRMRDTLVDYMKEAYAQKGKINEAGIATANKFTWKYSAEMLLENTCKI